MWCRRSKGKALEKLNNGVAINVLITVDFIGTQTMWQQIVLNRETMRYTDIEFDIRLAPLQKIVDIKYFSWEDV